MNNEQSAPYAGHYDLMPYGSSDDKRLEGFQASLNSDAKAIWILHGGQGCEKIVNAIEKGKITLSTNKKLIIGFSGVTNLHLYALKNGWPCLHGPVGTISKETCEITQSPINTRASLLKVIEAITGKSPSLTYSLVPINDIAKQLEVPIENTTVVGGCLNILISHAGIETSLTGKGNIVFIEEQPERPERVETQFMGLIRSGTFKNAKALMLGSFIDPYFNEERFEIVKPILLARLAKMLVENGINIPVFHGDNFGHGAFNDPLPLGTHAHIQPGKISKLVVARF
jgi:muramoyltetrapeptide carboxypeptidase